MFLTFTNGRAASFQRFHQLGRSSPIDSTTARRLSTTLLRFAVELDLEFQGLVLVRGRFLGWTLS
jgi:hypothetical protein